MIEDKELRDLFKIESEDHLQGLESGLLRLEANPADNATLEEAFREVHSLKGSAKMLGVRGIELIAHGIEDMLGAAKKGEAALSRDFIDRIYAGLDAVRKLVQEAVSGEPAGVDVPAALELLRWTKEKGIPAAAIPEEPDRRSGKPEQARAASGEKQFEADHNHGQTETGPLRHEAEFRIDSIRVDTRKLDDLMARAGELMVMRTNMAHRLTQVEEAEDLWEEALKHPLAPPDLRRRLDRLGSMLGGMRSELRKDCAKFESLSSELDEGVRSIRLLPFSAVFNLFPRMLRDMAKERSKEVRLEIEGSETRADKHIVEEMKDPIMHMIRNSIDHGIEKPEDRERTGKPCTGTIRLKAWRTDTKIIIEVADDGQGLDLEAIRKSALKRKIYGEDELAGMPADRIQSLIFIPGFTTSSFVTDISGRGIGLDVVRSKAELLKGSVDIESTPGSGCAMRVKLPVTLAAVRALIASVDGNDYAIPVEFVHAVRLVSQSDIFLMEGRETISVEGESVFAVRLADLLGPAKEDRKPDSPRPSKGAESSSCVILSDGSELLAVLVDGLLDEQEMVFKPLSALLRRVRNISGCTILGSGKVCMVLNPLDMMRAVKKRFFSTPVPLKAAGEGKKHVILLVEDSITTRTQEKRILEGAGYEVVTAVDGLDALDKLVSRSFNAVVTDILMPRMDGLTLTGRIRGDKRYRELPVILVTTLASDEDKKRGLDAGADAYISKPVFEQKVFLDTLKRII